MNSVDLIGRLVRDPEIRYTSGSQTAVAVFTIAIDRPQRRDGGEKQTDFPRIIAFGRLAENCEKYTKKGSRVGVHGMIQTGSYTNKNGDTVYTTDVVASRVDFIDWGNGTQENGTQTTSYTNNQTRNVPPTEEEAPSKAVQEEIAISAMCGDTEGFEATDEDVPF